MYDTIKTAAMDLLEAHRAMVPDDAVFTQAGVSVTRNGHELNAFWQSTAGEARLWGVVGINEAGVVLLRTWTPGSEKPEIATIAPDGGVA